LIASNRVWSQDEIATWLESRPVDKLPVKGAVKRNIERMKAKEAAAA
jgi:hypothetical protein